MVSKQDIETSPIPAKIESVGEVLRSAREEKGADLSAIADILKIRAVYLDAIENDKFTALPGQAYAIGFIKTYASFLGLDGEALAARYRAENTTPNSFKNPQLVDENIVIEDSPINATHLVFAGVFVLVALIVAYVATSEDEYLPPAKIVEQKAADIKKEFKPVVEDAPAVQVVDVEVRQPPVIPPINPNSFDIVNVWQAPIAPPAPAAPIEPVIASESETILRPIEEPVAKPTEPEQVAEHTPAEHNLRDRSTASIVLRAKGKTWVKVKEGFYKFDEAARADVGVGKALIYTVLDAGDVLYMPKGEGIFFSIGDVSMIDIEVDGAIIPTIVPTARLKARTNIEASADKLKNGSAYVQNRDIDG